MTKEKSVLIVEKPGRNGDSIAAASRKTGFRVETYEVEGGAQMLDFLLHRGAYQDPAKSPSPSLILVDLDGGSADAAAQVKRHPELRRIPMVAFTSSCEEADVRRCYETGANSLIQIPDSPEKLVEALKVLQHYWLESVELPTAR
jgi:CheY-like chemotaxis protein